MKNKSDRKNKSGEKNKNDGKSKSDGKNKSDRKNEDKDTKKVSTMFNLLVISVNCGTEWNQLGCVHKEICYWAPMQ